MVGFMNSAASSSSSSSDAATPAPSSDTAAAAGPVRVAYLGPEGTFTEQALRDMQEEGFVPADAEAVPVTSPRAALDMVRAGDADYACVALESSVDGPVSQTEDALAYGEPLQIFHEVLVPVVFSILVRPGEGGAAADLSSISTFTTHPVAEAQVRNWIAENIPNARFIPASSNGAAAQAVAEGKADAAAAPARAGDIHHLRAVAEGVADIQGAYTRFVLIGRPSKPTGRTGHDRTGVILTLQNRPASLLDALAELSTRGVDMSRISSRPLRREDGTRMGMYMFHVAIVGHIDDAAVAEALAGLYRSTESVRYLGSWPAADEVMRPGAHDGSRDRVNRHAGSAPPSYTASHQWIANLQEGRQ